MIMISGGSIAGKKIVKTLGLVRGNTIRARHIGKDILSALRNVVGGEIHEYMAHATREGGKYLDIIKAGRTQTQWHIETAAHMALMGLHGENYGPVARQMRRSE